MLELSNILDKRIGPIDGWGAYTLTEDGHIIAGKLSKGLSLSNVFPPKGKWKEVAEIEKAREEYRELFQEMTKEEWEEFQRLEKQSKQK